MNDNNYNKFSSVRCLGLTFSILFIFAAFLSSTRQLIFLVFLWCAWRIVEYTRELFLSLSLEMYHHHHTDLPTRFYQLDSSPMFCAISCIEPMHTHNNIKNERKRKEWVATVIHIVSGEWTILWIFPWCLRLSGQWIIRPSVNAKASFHFNSLRANFSSHWNIILFAQNANWTVYFRS